MTDKPRWKLFNRSPRQSQGSQPERRHVASSVGSNGLPPEKGQKLPSIWSIRERTRARDLHDLEDLLDFGMLRPDEAKVVRRALGRPEPEQKDK